MNTSVKRLTIGAMMVALSVILSLVIIFKLPYGGSVTAFCMLPVCLFAYNYSLRWGILAGFALGILQMLTSTSLGVSVMMEDFWRFAAMVSLDYLLAYACLGFTAVMRGKMKNERVGFALGICIAAAARLLAHAVSGYIFFRQYAEWFFSQDGFSFGLWILDNLSGQGLAIFYSFFYNASFLVPETLITVIMGLALFVPAQKLINRS